MSFRRLLVLVRHLPRDAATLELGEVAEWGVAEVLLAHIWQTTAKSKKPHPMLEAVAKKSKRLIPVSPERARKIAATRARIRARAEAIAAGTLT